MSEKIKISFDDINEQALQNNFPRDDSKTFLICPKCLSAHPDDRHSNYLCKTCHHEWQPPINSLGDAYFAGFDEIIVSLTDVAGEEFRLKNFPVTIGRNSEFKALQRNVSVSRQHCVIDFEKETHCFFVTPLKTGAGTHLNGQLIHPQVKTPIQPGDTRL